MAISRRGATEDLVAPEDAITGLFRMILYVRASPLVFGTWGFGRRWSRRAGLSALFHGPSGTGKTMAASLVARELEMDLFRSQVSIVWSNTARAAVAGVDLVAGPSRDGATSGRRRAAARRFALGASQGPISWR